MNNYPDCLISAIKGLKNDYKISEIITEFFKENPESKLKKKLNLLEKQFNKDIIFDYLFNYEKYHSSNPVNSVKQKSFPSQSKINNIENNKVFDSNKNINTESNVSSSILKKVKKVKYIGKAQDLLNKKKKREFNNENKSTEKKQSENKNKNKSKKKTKNKTKTKKLKEKSINNYIIDNYINIKKTINKNKDYDFMSNNEEKESDKKNEQNSFLDFYLNEDLNNQNNNENYGENENVNLENESKEEQNNNLEKLDLSSFIHHPYYDEPDFFFNGKREEGKKTGFGVYININKKIYFKGNWVENEIQGFGIYVNEIKHFNYKGNFVNSFFEGYGKLSITYNKTIYHYEGEFKKDKLNGFGIYYYNKNKTNYYMGEFENDKKSGIGISVKKGEFTFECEYKNDIEDGIGVLRYKDGDIYKGKIYEGKLEGYGIHIHNKKDKHQGSQYYAFFKNGKPKFGFYGNGNDYYFAEFNGLNLKKILKIIK